MSEIFSESLCAKCNAKCCRHVALEIDEPDCKRDYDNIRWYLVHQDVSVFIDEDGGWYLQFETPCAYIEHDGKCGIYEKRPDICRAYPPDGYNCDFDEGDSTTEFHFHTEQEFVDYLEARNIDWCFKKNIEG